MNKHPHDTICIPVGIIIVILVAGIFISGFSSMLIHAVAICPSPPCIVDNDHDGLTNEEELEIYHTKPNVADTDSDHLVDGPEIHATHTNPLIPDTDGEGLLDGKEYLGWVWKSEEVSVQYPDSPMTGFYVLHSIQILLNRILMEMAILIGRNGVR